MDQSKKLRLILSLSWITYVTAYLCRVNLSTVLDKLSVGIDISMELLGVTSSVYFVTYAVGQLLNGILGDRVDPYRFVILALFATGGINTVLGLQKSPLVFMLLWGLNGLCQSMFWSTLLRLLSFHAQDHQRKNVSTLMSASSVVGYLASWVGLGWLFVPYGHQPYFLVPGLLALLLIPCWFMLSRALPFTAEEAARAKTLPLRETAAEFLHDRLWYICLLCMTVGAIQEGAVFWLPMIFTNVLALGENSLLLLALIPVAKMAGLFLARIVLARMGEDPRRSILLTLSLSFCVAVVLVLTSGATSLLTVVLICLLIITINASNWFMISYLPLHFASRRIVATLVGVFDFSTYIGAAVMSGPLGDLLLSKGWKVLPLLWAALIAVSIALAFGGAGSCLYRKGKRR